MGSISLRAPTGPAQWYYKGRHVKLKGQACFGTVSSISGTVIVGKVAGEGKEIEALLHIPEPGKSGFALEGSALETLFAWVDATFDEHYDDNFAFEIEYAPFGTRSIQMLSDKYAKGVKSALRIKAVDPADADQRDHMCQVLNTALSQIAKGLK